MRVVEESWGYIQLSEICALISGCMGDGVYCGSPRPGIRLVLGSVCVFVMREVLTLVFTGIFVIARDIRSMRANSSPSDESRSR